MYTVHMEVRRSRSLVSLCASMLAAMLLVAVTGSVLQSAWADNYVDPKLSLAGDRFDADPQSGNRLLVGTITNMGDGACDIIMRVNLYGPSNVLIRNIGRRMNDIDSGSRWDFKIQVGDPQVQSYEIKSVRAIWHNRQGRPRRNRFS